MTTLTSVSGRFGDGVEASVAPPGLSVGCLGVTAAGWVRGRAVRRAADLGPVRSLDPRPEHDVVVVAQDVGLGAAAVRTILERCAESGATLVGLRTEATPPAWRDLLAGEFGTRPELTGAGTVRCLPPVDLARFNPRGFGPAGAPRCLLLDEGGAVVAQRLAADARDAGASAVATLEARAPWPRRRRDVRLRRPLRYLRQFAAVIDHPDFHVSPARHAYLLLRLSAAGVPVILNGLPEEVGEFLGERLSGQLVRGTTEIIADRNLRELHSVRCRRAAQRAHAPQARWRQLGQRFGFRVPGPPAVSVLLPTNRPEALEHAATQLRGQDHPRMEVVAVLHGDGFLDRDVARFRDILDRDHRVVRVPSSRNFGEALNVGVRHATGELLTKMDDDDWYSSAHVTDLVLAQQYARADLVGKAAEYVHLEEIGVTLRRFPRGSETDSRTLAGGALLLRRDLLTQLGGWRPVPREVDRCLIDDVLAGGGTVYRTHGTGYVLTRHVRGHTWDQPVDYFLRQSVDQRRGLDLAFAGIAPLAS